MTVHKRTPLFAAGFLLCAGGVLWGLSKASPVERPAPAESAASGPAAHGFAGSASCSSRGCHGGDAPVKDADVQRNEYTFMVMHDKHADAYAVLLSDRAKKMAENLAPTNPDGKAIPAHQDRRCLACHATPQSAWDPKAGDVATLNWQKAGVSCEACHGPASRGEEAWLTKHTSPAEWKKIQPGTGAKSHFTNLDDLRVQAGVCAGCHVGAPADEKNKIPARDCNHDIMAAGHPRLTFEFNSYRQNLPPHWNVARKKDDEAKVWFTGRVASAKASLELLIARAEGAKKDEGKTVRWPEFAEYRCYSCHTDLNPGWRTVEANEFKRPRGTLPYDTWYSTLLTGSSDGLKTGYEKLTLEMGKPTPSTDKVIETAKLLIGELDKLTFKDDPLDGAKKEVPRTWEDATQLVLAAAALKKDADKAALKTLLDALAFPKEGEGPRGYDGPAAERTEVKAALEKLLKK
jgi:hypothetical protein